MIYSELLQFSMSSFADKIELILGFWSIANDFFHDFEYSFNRYQ